MEAGRAYKSSESVCRGLKCLSFVERLRGHLDVSDPAPSPSYLSREQFEDCIAIGEEGLLDSHFQLRIRCILGLAAHFAASNDHLDVLHNSPFFWALIDYFDNDQFLLAAPATANLFINLLAMDPSFVHTFFDKGGHDRILHVYHMLPPEQQPLLLMLSFNFYGAGAVMLMDRFTALGLYISHTDKANVGDESLFWSPFVMISILRSGIELSDELIGAVMTTMSNVIKKSDPQNALWVLYFLFKHSGEMCTRLLTEEFAQTIAVVLLSEDEMNVRLGLYITAHLWLIDESDLRTIMKLNDAIPLDTMLQLLESPSSRISAGAAIAIGNYVALQRAHFHRAMDRNIAGIAGAVIENGSAEAKREAAMLLAGILADATAADLEGALTERVVEMLLEALELGDPDLITNLSIAFGQVLPELPWIADVMIQKEIEAFLFERLKIGFEVRHLYNILTHRRQAQIAEEGWTV
jgi:hypothetical protein